MATAGTNGQFRTPRHIIRMMVELMKPTAQDIIDSKKYAEEVSKATGLPIVATTVKAQLYSELCGKIDNLFPIKLQDKIL